MHNGGGVELAVLERICTYLHVDFGDIMEHVDEPKKAE
jgi:DNA-binding Xre family transcriptional regulator